MWDEVILTAEVAGVCALLLILIVVGVTWGRYRAIGHNRMMALSSLRPAPIGGSEATPASRGAWKHGVLRYGGEHVNFFPLGGLSRRPEHQWPRSEITLGATSTTAPPKPLSEHAWVVEVEAGGQPYELALDRDDYMALRSWLESAPPGTYLS